MVKLELKHVERLQKVQDRFCEATGVFAYCLDRNKKEITTISGEAEGLVDLDKYMLSKQVLSVLERVEDGSLEEQAVEELDDDDKRVAAIAVRQAGEIAFYWVIFDLNSVRSGAEHRFYSALDLLRETSASFVGSMDEGAAVAAEELMGESGEQNLRTLEATVAMVNLLNQDETIEHIMEQWLDILGRYLNVDTAQIFRINQKSFTMDVLCEWCNERSVSRFDRTSNITALNYLMSDQPVILSEKDADNEFFKEVQELGVKSVAMFPLLIREDLSGCMTVSLNYKQKAHDWSMAEIKFADDAVKILQSILIKQEQKANLASSYMALEAILDNVGCAIYVKDVRNGRMLFANRRLRNTFGKELQQRTFDDLLQHAIDNSRTKGYYEFQHEEKEHWYDLEFKEISWVDGKNAILYSLYDITDKKRYQRRIEQQAYTDFLTGLYNRMCCERDLARQIDEVNKNHETGALLYLDLDDFKHINDGLGHRYGDALLKAISHALQRVHGIENTCYRMGGDEFVILVPPKSYSEFDRILKQIQEIFAKPWFLKDSDYYCTMSMGVVTFCDANESVSELIKKADIAMYESKKRGKNRITSYDANLTGVSGKRLDMEKNMRDATADGYNEFEVYFQPIINISEGEPVCAGAEALIRWNSVKFGFIPPSEFIPLAEYLGLINPIGNFVLKEACAHCKGWNDKGYPDYKVNVNLSVVQLLQNDIVEKVELALQETGLNPKNLTLEVTESLAINDMERMIGILERINSLGVKIALDDFGTGYSSLNHIREIPFDVIKVDQSFVRDLAEDAYSQSFIKMVAELAETIGVSICVEGIETEAQYQVLRDMKVKYIQGYFFDKPMRRYEFENKYAK